MNLAEKALAEVFPEKHESRKLSIQYHNRFSPYNANVKYSGSEIKFALSSHFRELSEEIRQGVIEYLMCKMYGKQRSSTNMDLYQSFMKHLASVARIDQKDAYLQARFQVVNDHYFNGMMSEPNLVWGKEAYRKLGHYEYASDTILISSIFQRARSDEKVEQLLDFVLYHEMLHKKHQYDHTKARAQHHTKAFRDDEKKWHDKDIEKKLSWFLSKKRLKKLLWDW